MKKDIHFYLSVSAISAIFFLCGSGGFVNSTIQACIEAWPGVPVESIRMVSTLPSVVSLPVMLLVSRYVDRIGYRRSMLAGALLMTIGGLGPWFFSPSWTAVLVSRCIAGVGMGFFGLRNALLLKSFAEKDHPKYVGIGNAMNSLASVVMTPLAGILCAQSWKHPYLLYLLGLAVLLLVAVGVQEPTDDLSVKTAASDQRAGRLDKRMYGYFIIVFVESVILYPVLSGMSSFVIGHGIGSAAVAGVLIAFHNVGGFFAGFLVDWAERCFGKSVIPAAFLITMAGQLMILYIPNVLIIALGTALTGVGYFLLYSTITVYTGRISSPGNLAAGSTGLLIAMQLGIFLSVYYMTLAHAIFRAPGDVESSWLGSAVVCALSALAAFLFKNRLFPDSGKNREP